MYGYLLKMDKDSDLPTALTIGQRLGLYLQGRLAWDSRIQQMLVLLAVNMVDNQPVTQVLQAGLADLSRAHQVSSKRQKRNGEAESAARHLTHSMMLSEAMRRLDGCMSEPTPKSLGPSMPVVRSSVPSETEPPKSTRVG